MTKGRDAMGSEPSDRVAMTSARASSASFPGAEWGTRGDDVKGRVWEGRRRVKEDRKEDAWARDAREVGASANHLVVLVPFHGRGRGHGHRVEVAAVTVTSSSPPLLERKTKEHSSDLKPSGHAADDVCVHSFSQIRSGTYKEGNKRATPCVRDMVLYTREEPRDRKGLKDRQAYEKKSNQTVESGVFSHLPVWCRRSCNCPEVLRRARRKLSRLELLAPKRGMMERSRSSHAGACGKRAGLGGMSVDQPVVGERQGVHIRRRTIGFVALSGDPCGRQHSIVDGGGGCGGDGMCERASGRGDDVKRRVWRAAGISGVSLVGGVVAASDPLWRRLAWLGNGAAMLVSRETRTTVAADAETVAEGETKTETWNGAGVTVVSEAEPGVTGYGAEEVEDGAVSNKEAADGKTVTGEGEAMVVGGEAETVRGPETEVAGWRAKLELRQLEVRQLLAGMRLR
ncbi:hypothetical protein F5148DRAFT_1151269 [Russula earlei]|uniref:Uncharacterized protein n=1 Tax=Russula earlei TaxID=71964 RepID=A0ACC0U1T9_9AGAM|nr:hypothetical protein F5148DRAFT_1151269 [Russula earlei]